MTQQRFALSHATVVELLEGVDWLASLSSSEIGDLALRAETVEWSDGETIFEEGELGRCCYIVHQGNVRVIRRFPDGRRITLARLGAGDVFGELALFAGERRSATVQAEEQTAALQLAAEDLISILRTSPDASVGMMVTLANRLRETNERLLEYALATTWGRVVATLLAQVEARGAPQGRSGDIELIGTAADIARLAGTSRESATRALHSLENEGIISMRRGRTIVHDRDALSKYLS
jgi:CRP/FNR family transcriptional regulator, cyclic AMP receptor protein